jgi:hypothetical protein
VQIPITPQQFLQRAVRVFIADEEKSRRCVGVGLLIAFDGDSMGSNGDVFLKGGKSR